MSVKYKNVKKFNDNGQELVIKFGLGAIKALGSSAMNCLAEERKNNGKFKDIYDFSSRMGKKVANKKTIEALAKSGSLDSIHQNRCQILESCAILTKFATAAEEEKSSNQMNLFSMPDSNFNTNPPLKQVGPWDKQQKLQNEFEAFGYFPAEHPISDYQGQLKERGVSNNEDLSRGLIKDNHIIYISGVVAYTKHKTGPRGRYCYVTISDPSSIIDLSIFDEDLISLKRDLIEDGQYIVAEALVRIEEGSVRMLVKDIWSLQDFLKEKQKTNHRKYTKAEPRSKGNFQKDSNQEPNFNIFKSSREDELLKKTPLDEIKIEVKNREEVINLKSILNNNLVKKKEVDKTTKVSLVINEQELLLLDKFILDERNLEKIKQYATVKKYL
jgi:DNA polymerase III alpha subunit